MNTNPLSDPSSIRFAMGELSSAELALAQSTIVRMGEILQERGLFLVPKEPTDALLMSISIRLDHALGVPGYYDQFEGFALNANMQTHAEVLARTLDVASKAHRAMIDLSTVDASLIEELQKMASAELAPGNKEAAGIVRASVRYMLTRPSLALVSKDPSAPILGSIAAALETADRQSGQFAKTLSSLEKFSPQIKDPIQSMRSQWMMDAGRIHEEIVGLGFYRPQPTQRNPRPH